MVPEAILDELRGIDFFRGLEDTYLEQLAEISRYVEFPARAEIFRESDVAKEMYVIISGQVSLVTCTPKTGCRQLMVVGDGDLIGWSPLVERQRLFDTAHTAQPTKAIAIDGHKILEICEKNPQFGFEFMRRVAKVLAERLSATRLQILDICGVRLPEVQIESD